MTLSPDELTRIVRMVEQTGMCMFDLRQPHINLYTILLAALFEQEEFCRCFRVVPVQLVVRSVGTHEVVGTYDL